MNSPWNTILKILAIIGVVGLFGTIVLRAWFTTEVWKQTMLMAPKTAMRGSPGSMCGGSLRLPCGPGTRCVGATDVQLGTCHPAMERVAFESCARSGAACGAGLYCVRSNDRGSCQKLNASAPFLISLKPEGMEPSGTGYRWTPAATGAIEVRAQNAKAVFVGLEASGGALAGPEQEFLLTPDGVFRGSIRIPVQYRGSIRAIAEATDGSFASLIVPVE